MNLINIILLCCFFAHAAVWLIQHNIIRYCMLRIELLYAFFLYTIMYFYIYIRLARLYLLIRGGRLVHYDLSNHLKFSPPEFINRGFSDLQIYDKLWKLKHKRFSYAASQGFRSYMEDRMHYMFDPNMNLSIFGIFDGHGGMYVSDYLEVHFACSIRDRLMKIGARRRLSLDSSFAGEDPSCEAVMTEVCRIDDAISQLNPKFTSLTGSTCIAAILEHNRFLTIVNVGDSRAVACDLNNRAVSLSKDHKPNDPEEKRRIELSGGFVSDDHGTPRVQGILAVSRSFGDTLLKRLGVLTAKPDVRRIDLSSRRLKFLIVGTDGFWDVITNKEAVKLANGYLKSHGKKDWHRIATHLVKIALERHSQDNVSVLFIKLE